MTQKSTGNHRGKMLHEPDKVCRQFPMPPHSGPAADYDWFSGATLCIMYCHSPYPTSSKNKQMIKDLPGKVRSQLIHKMDLYKGLISHSC